MGQSRTAGRPVGQKTILEARAVATVQIRDQGRLAVPDAPKMTKMRKNGENTKKRVGAGLRIQYTVQDLSKITKQISIRRLCKSVTATDPYQQTHRPLGKYGFSGDVISICRG